jgi:hypothetical protein
MFQMGNVGPMLSQAHHFRQYAPEKLSYAIDGYTNEANRLYGVLDRRLAEPEYLAGDYSIAAIANFPWLRSPDRQGVAHANYPNVVRWFDAIDERPPCSARFRFSHKMSAAGRSTTSRAKPSSARRSISGASGCRCLDAMRWFARRRGTPTSLLKVNGPGLYLLSLQRRDRPE